MAHDKRLSGQSDKTTGQLMLTDEDGLKREGSENTRLLLTREKWLKRLSRGGTESSQTSIFRSNGGFQGGPGTGDKSHVRYFNCLGYGHFAAECRKPRREKESKPEANLALLQDDEPALLFIERNHEKGKALLLNEGKVAPKLSDNADKKGESNVWYLANGASNHMTREHKKFKKLDEMVTGQV